MNKYQKAAMLFGTSGVSGESDAIAKYLDFVGSMTMTLAALTPEEKTAVGNVSERIEDELNHLLGDTLDAINLAGLKIAPDNIDKIFEGLIAAVKRDDSDVKIVEESTYSPTPFMKSTDFEL